jgi:hypothetical protein
MFFFKNPSLFFSTLNLLVFREFKTNPSVSFSFIFAKSIRATSAFSPASKGSWLASHSQRWLAPPQGHKLAFGPPQNGYRGGLKATPKVAPTTSKPPPERGGTLSFFKKIKNNILITK